MQNEQLIVRLGNPADFRLVGGRVGASIKDEFKVPPGGGVSPDGSNTHNGMTWIGRGDLGAQRAAQVPGAVDGVIGICSHYPNIDRHPRQYTPRPVYCMCCLEVPSPPTVLIYELSLDASVAVFDAAHFANVERIVFWRTDTKPTAIAILHKDKWRVSVASTMYEVNGGADVDVDRNTIAQLIPWHYPLRDIQQRGWKPTPKYFHLMIPLDPKWITAITDSVHAVALWEAYHHNGLPRANTIDVNAWHGVTQRIAQATADFVPRVFINDWEPDFPSAIKRIE